MGVKPGSAEPEIAKAAVAIPVPPKPSRARFKSATSVQADPFQDSVTAVIAPCPPKAKAEVLSAPADPN